MLYKNDLGADARRIGARGRKMKRDEAIELLEDLDGAIEDNQGRDYDEAFRMAIEALKHKIHTEIHERVKGGDAEMPSIEQYPYMKQSPDSGADLISRADALEQMAQAECGLHYDDCEADNCSCDYIWRILNIPSAESKTREWIPVSEGLPKKDGEYLVTTLIPCQDYNNVLYEDLDIMFLTFNNGKFFDEFETTDYHDFVAAWMPKPKPYRKDGK